MTRAKIRISRVAIAVSCRHHHIRTLARLGSVLGEDFRSESAIDVQVECEPNHVQGLIWLAGME